ncbi:hypothetical protein EST38_g403 [Candolleomyces aberdarensis]|uniref:Uncharacterized protein n=1 Tax=Candolleomyces aberdarensis TaxID=2316362 RepID=A0A4Q2DZM6_9AGAR|nr:hypothetical protein EST38_g403 [Candolleomyces aberdarensis]
MRRYTRSASLAITSIGLITNALIAFYVVSGSNSYKWEPDSEWESSGESWKLNGVKLLWGLLAAYFTGAGIVCGLGLWGILKNKPTYIRFYRDYSIADFCFCAFFIALATYGSFAGQTRAGVCEHFSHYPELMRDMLEMGLSIENCEQWLERAVVAFLAVLFIIMAVRLHFLLSLSNYYSHLVRHQYHQRSGSIISNSSTGSSSGSTQLQRIYLLPRQPQQKDSSVEIVYAPVPLDSLPIEMQVQAMEAWVQQPVEGGSEPGPATASSSSRGHHHKSHHHRRRSGSGGGGGESSQTGRIRLSTPPGESLLPPYSSAAGSPRSKV